ncbi:MAG: hypothetical protein MUF00_14685 [Gemmatimonadaceae bacterium]|nr:hypothetical protein [Gemmatimonadaceae bacterium]
MIERAHRLIVLAALTLAPTIAAMHAQPARARTPVRLVIHPRVGDTLRLRYEQRTDVRGDDEGPMERSVSTFITVHAHSIVEASEPALTTVRASTDSGWVRFRTVDPRPGVGVTEQKMMLPQVGSKMRVQVATDGATEVVSAAGAGGGSLSALLSQSPAMLPKLPVAVGDTWVRDIPLPSAASVALRGAGDVAGTVRARFRFDSLTARGKRAFVSVTAALRRDGTRPDAANGARVVSSGTLRGTLVLDRERAWMVEMRTSVSLVSDLVPGAGDLPPPMLFAPLGRSPRRAVVQIDQFMQTR